MQVMYKSNSPALSRFLYWITSLIVMLIMLDVPLTKYIVAVIVGSLAGAVAWLIGAFITVAVERS